MEKKRAVNIRSTLGTTFERGMLYSKQKAEYTAVKAREHARGVMSTTKQVLYNALATVLTFVLIISIAVFMYGTFYYAYMPLEMHEEPVNLQFRACPDQMGLCSFPNASVHLHPKIKLMQGQPYSISLRLEVPDSVNNQALGMFMSCLEVVYSNKNKEHSCKSSILEFRSELLRIIETMAYSPFFLTGTSTQRQWITINYFSKFQDDPHFPAKELILEVQSKYIQVYSATLLVHAEFSGLRHIMYHHPWISTVTGVLSNVVILTLIILMSWTRFFTPEEIEQMDRDSGLKGSLKDEVVAKLAGEQAEKEDDLFNAEKDDIEILKEAVKMGVENIK
eukprot:TRINITY_DN893_c0_g1_i2.p1 TRINITY_DN893_c0_g1~~TRINITY_DN893_c0_g1_i2.p1  ORF type:complete len:335 (+),score=53.88 TRINITY_DN893_c0_g1_i2:37-1041(+)